MLSFYQLIIINVAVITSHITIVISIFLVIVTTIVLTIVFPLSYLSLSKSHQHKHQRQHNHAYHSILAHTLVSSYRVHHLERQSYRHYKSLRRSGAPSFKGFPRRSPHALILGAWLQGWAGRRRPRTQVALLDKHEMSARGWLMMQFCFSIHHSCHCNCPFY